MLRSTCHLIILLLLFFSIREVVAVEPRAGSSSFVMSPSVEICETQQSGSYPVFEDFAQPPMDVCPYGYDNGGSGYSCSCCDNRYAGKKVYGYGEALFLRRDNKSTPQPVVIDNQTLSTIVNTSNIDFSTESGIRTLVGWRQTCTTAWELSYFGLQDWSTTSQANGNDNLAIPGDQGLATLDFLDADTVSVFYNAEIHNAEANLVQEFDYGTKLLLGFRYFGLNELFRINSVDLDTGSSDYTIQTKNQLYGAQIGLMFDNSQDCNRIQIIGKVGVFSNSNQQSTFLGDFDNSTVFRNSETTGQRTSAIGEVNLIYSREITQTWSFRCGYNLMWVQGVALAPDQLDFSFSDASGLALHNRGDVFFHGANVGIAANW